MKDSGPCPQMVTIRNARSWLTGIATIKIRTAREFAIEMARSFSSREFAALHAPGAQN